MFLVYIILLINVPSLINAPSLLLANIPPILALGHKNKCFVDGWMTCDFRSYSTIFQSYQDIGRVIMKGCVQWNLVYD